MRFLLILSVLLASFPAYAGKNDSTWNPPARYDKPYKGKLRVYYLPQHQVVSTCKKIRGSATMEQRGCAVANDTACTVIVVDKPFMGATPKAVLRHELGHCNGWHESHPD